MTAILKGIFDSSGPLNIKFMIKELMSKIRQSFLNKIKLYVKKSAQKFSRNSPKCQKASRCAENKPGVDKQ